jgi:hypothetical protein
MIHIDKEPAPFARVYKYVLTDPVTLTLTQCEDQDQLTKEEQVFIALSYGDLNKVDDVTIDYEIKLEL